MKFTTVLALATGAVAMPWNTNSRHSNSKDEITLRVKVGNPHTKIPVANYDICWLICASEEIQCPEGWHAQQQGDCWTCCRSGGSDNDL